MLTMEVERPEVKVETQEVAGRKRVAHEVRYADIHDYEVINSDLSGTKV